MRTRKGVGLVATRKKDPNRRTSRFGWQSVWEDARKGPATAHVAGVGDGARSAALNA